MRRRLLTELLAQAGLAQSELQKERVKADRDARLAQTWAGLVPQAIDAGTRIAEGVGKAQDAEAARLAAQYQGYTGDNVKRVRVDPERGPLGEVTFLKPADQEAQRIVSERVKDPLNDFLGIAKGYKQAVREKALAGIAANIAEGRKGAQAAAQQEAKALAEYQRGMRSEGRDDRKLSQVEDRLKQQGALAEEARRLQVEKAQEAQALREKLAQEANALKREEMQRRSSEAEKERQLRRELAQQRGEKQNEPKPQAGDKKQAAQKQPTAAKATPLPKDVVKDIANIDQAIALLDNVARQKAAGIDTGWLAATRNSAAQAVGVDDPRVTGFRADLGENIAQYIKNISGATVSASEREALLKNIPSLFNNDMPFDEKLKRARARLLQSRDAILKANQAVGNDVGRLPDIRPSDGPKKTVQERVNELLQQNKDLSNAEIYRIIQAEGVD